MAFKTIYLTGAPASGKTTVGGQLEACEKPVLIWRYGERLRQYLQERQSDIAYEAMRQESSSIITADDIRAVDARLLDFVSQSGRRQSESWSARHGPESLLGPG